jgi:hypothetical protein
VQALKETSGVGRDVELVDVWVWPGKEELKAGARAVKRSDRSERSERPERWAVHLAEATARKGKGKGVIVPQSGARC